MTAKLNIAILCTGLHGIGGGVANHISNWIKYHDRKKYNVKFIYYSRDKKNIEEYMQRNASSAPDDLIYLEREKLFFPLFTIIKLVKILKDLKTDILHSVFLQSDIIGVIAGKLSGTKILISNIEGKLVPENVNAIKKSLYILGNKIFRKYINKSIIVSKGLLQYLESKKQVNSDRSEVVHTGIENREIKNNKNNSGIRKVGCISRFSKEKGVIYFIRAIPVILKKHKNVKFILAGDGAEHLAIENEAMKLDTYKDIVFTGWVNDVYEILSDMDILVMPSLTEGLPFTLLEAFNSAVPVVATNVGGIPDIVKNEITGILVPSGDSEAIAKAVIDLLNRPEKMSEIGLNEKTYFEKNLLIEHEINKIENIYQSLYAAV